MLMPRGRGRGRKKIDGSECKPGQQLIPMPVPFVRNTDVLAPVHKPESTLQTVYQEELDVQLKRNLVIVNFPEKPSLGTAGKLIKLVSNCYSLKVPSGCIYHYDVTITKKITTSKKSSTLSLLSYENEKKYRCLNTKTNREVIKLMLDTNAIFKNAYAVYDGMANLYTRNRLNSCFPIKCEIVIPSEDRQQDIFIVQTKPVYKENGSCCINFDSLHSFYEKKNASTPLESIMALETILRQGPCLKSTPIGRSFFSSPNLANMHPLGGGLEIWFGFHQSIRLGQWGPMVNLDRTATPFYRKGPILSFIADVLRTETSELRRRPYLSDGEIKKISNKLKSVKIEVTHMKNYKRKYRVVRMTKNGASNVVFEMTENGKTVKKTITAYFRERYGINLEFPNLPCLQVQPEGKEIYLPVEVCDIIEGQHSKQKLDPMETSRMISLTASTPSERFSKVKQIAENPEFNNDAYVRHFGVEMSKKPIKLKGRVLDSPTLLYKDAETKPIQGFWTIKQKNFLHGAVIGSWVLLSFAPNVKLEHLKSFENLFMQVSRATGMSIKTPRYVNTIDASTLDIKHILSDIKVKYQAELAVIVLPVKDKFIYRRIKQLAEINLGLRTQCIKETNVTNPKNLNATLVSNICLKINAKAGGENNCILPKEMPSLLCKPVIIIGADVNHTSVSEGSKKSLAACVGSLNKRLSKYAVCVRAQENWDEKKQAVEIILDLMNMVKELLRTFYKHTKGKKPEKIIFYRDGVSEGQLEKVKEHEVKCVREACRALQDDYEPGITFIVVQKRHHVRFMTEDPGDRGGKNVPPGTIVDTAVTDPMKFDFFLCSHLGLKGTSRPSHYTVLEDDNGFSADDLQKLSYQLCHTNARCTKSISIPVPVAYADLAAYRARHHLDAGLEEISSNSSNSSDSFQRLLESVMDTIKVTGELKEAMYFV